MNKQELIEKLLEELKEALQKTLSGRRTIKEFMDTNLVSYKNMCLNKCLECCNDFLQRFL